ncbi:MAG: hypothetical protein EZS28_027265 [Streblomastix strix]|uniref:Uncharacterized protein n=1 Tax=Streblomastix strix TaxID=222440 RepID=A0A5J4V3A4_9EUKA|nr:MAG: hypothetical protein EZS28_027265 [Streblomastix strix]
MEDKFILGCGNGQTGALHSISLGKRLQKIMNGKWYQDLPTLFTTKAYSGAKLHSLLLVEEEKIIDIQKDKLNRKISDGIAQDLQKKLTQYPYKQSQVLKVCDNLRCTYSSQVFALHENIIEPIDSLIVGVDSTKKTLAFGSAQGAFIQITSSEVRVIPTLRYSTYLTNQTQQSQQQQKDYLTSTKSSIYNNQQSKRLDEQAFDIQAEFIGYDVQHGISWQAPNIFSEEQCLQHINNLQKNQINSNIDQSQVYQSITSFSSYQNHEQQKVIFECACISDNIIAVSYECIVFVMIWNPSKPKITSNGTNILTSVQQSTIAQLPAFILPIATLCFPSHVRTLTASTICTRSFLVVGCESPPAIFLFRLDNVIISQQNEDKRKKIWDEGEKLINSLKYRITYPTVQRPDLELIIHNGIKYQNQSGNEESKHSIRIGEGNQCKVLSMDKVTFNNQRDEKEILINKQVKFIEVSSGSHQFVEIQYTSNATLTRLLDLYPQDNPDQIILTTFARQLHIYSQEEIDDNDKNYLYSSSSNQKDSLIKSQIEKYEQQSKQSYFRNEGVALFIAGHNGQLISTIIPLTVILDFPPEQSNKEKKLKTTQFFFPSLVSTLKLYPQRIKMADDDGIVYVYGDKASALTWNDRACKILWNDLECTGIIHSLAPIHIVEEETSLEFNKNEDIYEENEKQDQNESQLNDKEVNKHKSQIPHPTVVWIDFTDQKLTFGTINKRHIVIRDVKDMPSLPLAVAHIPTLHAIAILF